jgi:TetR/AcrR family transcriptional regulator, cholesterol catabolism regulator
MPDDSRRRSAAPAAEGKGDQEVSTAERLLAGSAELFREKGYAGTTTRALSALLGIQNASLYHYVDGKEDLLYRLCIASLNEVAAVFAATSAKEFDPVERLEHLARRYVEQALLDRDRHATMLTELRSLSPGRRAEVIALRDQNVAVVESTIRSAQNGGKVRSDIDAKYLTLALFNLLNWTIFWFDPNGELDEQQIGEILWAVFAEGVTGAGRELAKRTDTPPSRKTDLA